MEQWTKIIYPRGLRIPKGLWVGVPGQWDLLRIGVVELQAGWVVGRAALPLGPNELVAKVCIVHVETAGQLGGRVNNSYIQGYCTQSIGVHNNYN